MKQKPCTISKCVTVVIRVMKVKKKVIKGFPSTKLTFPSTQQEINIENGAADSRSFHRCRGSNTFPSLYSISTEDLNLKSNKDESQLLRKNWNVFKSHKD